MTDPGNDVIHAILLIAFAIASSYALGRIHQWSRDSAQRERSYRAGYDLASDSMLDMAIRQQSAAPVGGATGPAATRGVPLQPIGAGARPRGGRTVGNSRRRIAASLACAAPGRSGH